MDRAALTAYLQREFAEVIAEAGIDFVPILDAVERIYAGMPDLALVWTEPLADYYLLRRAKRAFLAAFDVGVEGDSYRLNQLFKNVEAELANAEARVAWIVAPDFWIGDVVTVRMPFLERSAEEWGSTSW